MKVAIVAHALRAAGGISVAYNFIQTLAELRPGWNLFCVIPDLNDYDSLALCSNIELFRFSHSSYFQRIAFDLFELPKMLQEQKPEKVFSLGNMPVRVPAGASQVVLIQKAQFFYSRKHKPGETLFKRFLNSINKLLLKTKLANVDAVLLQTEVMRERFESQISYTGKVALLPNAVSSKAISGKPVDFKAVEKLPKSERPFVALALARYYPHKNLELIVDCFQKYREELDNVEVWLTIEADQHPNARMLLESIESLGLSAQIKNIGTIKQSELQAFFSHVNCLLLPTLLESHSASYIEAMMFGCPILTSDLDFALGICGNQAAYFNPWSIESLRDALLKEQTTEKSSAITSNNNACTLDKPSKQWAAAIESMLLELGGPV